MVSRNSSTNRMRRNPIQVRSQERVERILNAAEALFEQKGYELTTTNAISKQAKVSIGSLYQFFPDKAAILLAIALRYGNQLQQKLSALNAEDKLGLPLTDYVERLIDTASQFFVDYPGYYAVYMNAQSVGASLDAADDSVDAALIADLSAALSQREASLTVEDCDAIACVLVKSIGNLLWLSLSQPDPFRQRLIAESKRMALSYLSSYSPDKYN